MSFTPSAMEAIDIYQDLDVLVKGGLLKALTSVMMAEDSALQLKAFQILESLSGTHFLNRYSCHF